MPSRSFRIPTRAGSAHYVISYAGQVWQMVLEKDIAWHAGNWDYNTRSIGIEHEGYAYTPGLYTVPEYRESAKLAGSICSRWGVPMDRKHVIGHYQVPDPDHPGLFGGSDHHTDPGPYWNWSYYLSARPVLRQSSAEPAPHGARSLPTFSGDGTASVRWQAARTCHNPIDSYTVVAQPGGMRVVMPGTATSAPFAGLTNGVDYSFTVTANNSDGQDSLASNAVTPGPPLLWCATLSVQPGSPQSAGVAVRFTAASSVCANPQYQFSVQDSKGNWVIQKLVRQQHLTWDSYLGTPPVRTAFEFGRTMRRGNPDQPEASTTCRLRSARSR